jgi:hypothetical protein
MKCIGAKKDGPNSFTRYRRGSEWEASEPGKGQREDEVELRNIHVYAIQIRQVKIDGEADRNRSHSAGVSTDGYGECVELEGCCC